MAALPSRPRVRYTGQERPAIDLAQETGELAALPADLEAPGTATRHDTPSPHDPTPKPRMQQPTPKADKDARARPGMTRRGDQQQRGHVIGELGGVGDRQG